MSLSRGGVRRLQKLGSSSLVVTLPKEWVREMGLKQGDPVYVVIEGGSLRIVPAVNSETYAASRVRLTGSTPATPLGCCGAPTSLGLRRLCWRMLATTCITCSATPHQGL
ncbi:AbrB/MazE/SpoVT family DNA-binding domain-containing protein [Aeropyrum camini]|uniref:AbrB/MazE/SpoVT family DNA-binding domain-containing protein n=1 Tax=Aeropyrum camini TaxID=229980 RepID=UPI000788514F|nr:AbrB/MazE/SpoVT family DNA-binding domain-containing protein [Aeropyrum camini]